MVKGDDCIESNGGGDVDEVDNRGKGGIEEDRI
jgi:hypothetical protein